MNFGDILICVGIAFICFALGVAANSVTLRPTDLTTIATKCDKNGGIESVFMTDKVIHCADGATFRFKVGAK